MIESLANQRAWEGIELDIGSRGIQHNTQYWRVMPLRDSRLTYAQPGIEIDTRYLKPTPGWNDAEVRIGEEESGKSNLP